MTHPNRRGAIKLHQCSVSSSPSGTARADGTERKGVCVCVLGDSCVAYSVNTSHPFCHKTREAQLY